MDGRGQDTSLLMGFINRVVVDGALALGVGVRAHLDQGKDEQAFGLSEAGA